MAQTQTQANSKKILFITYDGLTDPLGQSQILPYYLGLAERGYRIHILSNEKGENFQQFGTIVEEKLRLKNIAWRYTFYQNTPPILGTLLNIRRLKKELKKWYHETPFDVFHCRSIIPAMIAKSLLKSNTKLVFDIRGFWADERVEGGLWNLNNPIYKWMYNFFKKKEKFLFQEADYIISLTENAKRHILKHFKTKGKVQVIPCAADLEHFNYNSLDKSKQQQLKKELGIKEHEFILSYIGSLGTRYRLHDMLRFFKWLKKENSTSRFLFISRHDPDYIKEQAKKLDIHLDDLIIAPSSYQDIPYFISLSQASIFFIVTSFTGKAVSPTKQAEVMGMGLPIVANAGLGDTDEILNDRESGIVITDFEDATLKHAVQKILNHSTKSEVIRAVALKRFSLQEAIANYAHVYENL